MCSNKLLNFARVYAKIKNKKREFFYVKEMNLSACMFNLLYEKLAKSLSNSTDEQRL